MAKLHYLSFIVNLIFQIRKWLMNCSYIRIPCLFDTEDEYGDAVDDGDRIEDNAVGSSLDMSLTTDVLCCPVMSQTVCLSRIISVWWIFC